MTYREEVKEIPADPWCINGLSLGQPFLKTVGTIQPNTDTVWIETGMNHSSQWAECLPAPYS